MVARYEISYGIYDKITRYSAIYSLFHQHLYDQFPAGNYMWNMVFKANNKDTRTTPPYSSVSIFDFEQVNAGWVKDKGVFLHIKKPTCSENQVVHLVTTVKIELRALTQVSHVTKKLKK